MGATTYTVPHAPSGGMIPASGEVSVYTRPAQSGPIVTGQLVALSQDTFSPSDASAGDSFGVSLNDAENTESLAVLKFTPEVTFRTRLFGWDATNTTVIAHTLAAADIGAEVGLEFVNGSTAAVAADPNAAALVLDVAPGSAIGDSNAEVIVKVLNSVPQDA